MPEIIQSQQILSTTSGSASGTACKCRSGGVSFDISLTGTGVVSATVVTEGSNGGVWHELATTSLSGTNSDSDGFSNNGGWALVRARTTAISGTDATVVVMLGGAT
jgi:hypothetical protein